MSGARHHAFAKMNGIGNEIVVVDLRDSPAIVTPEEARAVASPTGVHYDQLMLLQPPRLDGHRGLSSASTTMTARKLPHAATACAAWARRSVEDTGRTAAPSRPRPGC